MPSVVQAIQKLLGGKERDSGQEILPPEMALENIAQNIQAMTSMIRHDQTVTLTDEVHAGGMISDVEIFADRIHLQNRDPEKSRLVNLDDSLEEYSSLEEEIRCQLGRKIARLLPGLAHSKKTLALEHALRVLKIVSQDQNERVRMMVAQELSRQQDAPAEIVHALAWDPSLKVSCPILEFSPLMSDDDLLDIIQTSKIPGVVEAIARRDNLGVRVGDAIADTHMPVAIHHLLKNETSHISGRALTVIVDLAPEYEIWHESLVHRPELNMKTVNRIAGFISQHLISELESQGKIKRVQRQDTHSAVSHRLRSWTTDQQRAAEMRVKELHETGRLDEDVISAAVDEINEPFVIAALAARSGIENSIVKRIIRSQSGSAITALAWRAGLSMRTAMALQIKIGRVHHTKMLNARGGTDYPIPASEMTTYLEIFTG